MITLDGLPLPKGLFFRDDIAYTKIKQKNIESTTGKTIILRGTAIDGRVIILTGTAESNTLTRLQVKEIASKRGALDPMDLVIHGTTYTVHFDLAQDDHFVALPLWDDTTAMDDDSPYYIQQLKFIEIKVQ